jgi:hypothetical protein
MSDAGKAKIAVQEFERDNPSSGSRKKLIDWAQFKKRYGVRVSITQRQGETQMDIDDWWRQRGQKNGWTRAESDVVFRQHVTNGTFEVEGEGPHLSLWVTDLKQRFRDVTKYVDNEEEESSKQIRDPSRAEREALRRTVRESVPDHSEGFLRSHVEQRPQVASQAAKEGDGDDAGALGGAAKKRKGSTIDDEGSTASGRRSFRSCRITSRRRWPTWRLPSRRHLSRTTPTTWS